MRGGGGGGGGPDFNRGGGGGFRDNYAPAPDFGDRYSANRSKDRDRRERFGGPPGGGGGRFGDRRDFNQGGGGGFDRYNGGGPPNRGPGGSSGGGPPMMMNDNRLPPRFKKMVLNNQQQQQQQQDRPPVQQPGGPAPVGVHGPNNDSGLAPPPPMHQNHSGGRKDKDVEVSLRPPASSMLFKPKTPSMLPKSAISLKPEETSPMMGGVSGVGSGFVSLPAPQHNKVMMQQQEPAIIVKQGSLDKGRKGAGNKQKGPTREEVFVRVEKILNGLLETKSTNEAVEAWKEDSWLPSKMSQTAVTHFFKLLLAKESAEERELALQFLTQLIGEGGAIHNTHCQEALNKILGQQPGASDAGSRQRLASAAAWSIVVGKTLTLREFDEILKQQLVATHPLLVETLQDMLRLLDGDKGELKALYDGAGPALKMSEHVPEAERSDDRLVEVLEAAGLAFLMPLLAVRREMSKHVESPDDLKRYVTFVVRAAPYCSYSNLIRLLPGGSRPT